jgi:hypothetical protein
MAAPPTKRGVAKIQPVQQKDNAHLNQRIQALEDLVEQLQLSIAHLTAVIEQHNYPSQNTHNISDQPDISIAAIPMSYASATQQESRPQWRTTSPPMTQLEVDKCRFAPRKRAEFSIVYIQGLRRMAVGQVKRLCAGLGIEVQNIRNVSFIGAQTLELVVFADQADAIAAAFVKAGFKHNPDLHPLHTDFTSGPRTAQLTEEEQLSLARSLAANRLERILARIPQTRRFSNLRSFLSTSLGTPVTPPC